MKTLSLLSLVIRLTCGVIIECEYIMVSSNEIGTLYSCAATVNSSNIPKYLSEVRGVHWSGKENEHVELFKMKVPEDISTIPKNIDHFFPNLVVLRWRNTNLKSISADDLKQFKKLAHLELNNNRITSLESDLFKHTRKLVHIDFNENLIERVGHNLFRGLKSLERIYFHSNPCIDKQAESPDEIEELKKQLMEKCSSGLPAAMLTAREGGECRCTVNKEIDDLQKKLNELSDDIVEIRKEMRAAKT